MKVHQIVHCKTNVLTLINLVSTLNSGIFAFTPLLALRTVPGLWFRKGFQFKTVQVKPLIGAIIIITANHLAMFSSSAITDGYRWPTPQEKLFSFRDIVFTKVLVWENSLNKEGLFCPNDKINVFQNRWTEELQLDLWTVKNHKSYYYSFSWLKNFSLLLYQKLDGCSTLKVWKKKSS